MKMADASKKYDLMVRYIHKQCNVSGWLNSSDCQDPSKVGVMIQLEDDEVKYFPEDLDPAMIEIICSLDAKVAFTMVSKTTATLFRQISPYQNEIVIQPHGIRISVVGSLDEVLYLASTKKLKGHSCLVRREEIFLVWSNAIENILPHGAESEKLLMETLWGESTSTPLSMTPRAMTPEAFSPAATPRYTMTQHRATYSEKYQIGGYAMSEVGHASSTGEQELVYDPESATASKTHRPMILTHSFMVGLGMMALVIIQMGGLAQLIAEVCIDGSYARFAYLLMVPLSSTLALFFFTSAIACLFQLFGPVGDVKGNSRYHSAVAPDPARHQETEYPHITIQIPVYKEGLTGVIIPTVASVKEAIKHYESIGGTASIYMNEDGMQTISPELAEARQKYYKANNVGWCARPPHKKDGYLRKGQFKKASNMNYCLDFSIRVEDELLRLIAEYEQANPGESVTVDKENEIYAHAMQTIISSDEGRTWAEGNVRLGEFILLLDCDTKVPVDCLQYGALEMLESPDVAIIQHSSGVMQVVHNMFENAITYLTNLIYHAIEYSVGSGDLACFVGHNAFLRWKAIQSVAFKEDGMTKYWSDSHVSEDFDQALRLQIAGFIIRLASYHHGGFQEGVSLTVFDELARWEKYTYGCNELLFNPIKKWITKGPFTPLLWKLLRSNVKSSSKITILGYVFTYYAIAAALPFCLMNYFLEGWIADMLDHYYLDSFRIMILLLVVFNLLSPISYNYLLARQGRENFFRGLGRTIKWMPLFMVFFGGLSIHLCKAIFCHFFSLNMEWNSTAKELESTGFFITMDKIIKDFKWLYVILLFFTAVLVFLALWAPRGWEITDFSMILPVGNQLACHFFLPLALGLF